jgi:hypothetical protein
MDAILVNFRAARIDLDFVSDKNANDDMAPNENFDFELASIELDDLRP